MLVLYLVISILNIRKESQFCSLKYIKFYLIIPYSIKYSKFVLVFVLDDFARTLVYLDLNPMTLWQESHGDFSVF